MNEKISRMKELITILNKASELYYHENTSMMTDYEYDRLYDELIELEKSTNMTLSNSPTNNVEPVVSDALEQVSHPKPMLSLDKTKEIDELISFLGDKDGVLSWKLDGITIVLTYDKGTLVSGVTRGSGIIGEVVTNNVKKFKNIPLNIPHKGRLVIRGEAIIKYDDFKRMNEELGDDDEMYKNPRNLCSGSVRQLDSSITAKRNVNFIAFSLIESDNYKSNYISDNFDWLNNQGFEVVEHIKVNSTNLRETVLKYKESVKTYNIPSDGLVLSFNDIEYGNLLGTTAKFPRNSIAFKWQDETEKTRLINVEWNTSRTGLINPIAVFEPVTLEGTTVSRASLHNVSILEGLKLGINDEILVYKANMIIPQIASNLTKSNNLVIPEFCPICQHNTEMVENNTVKYLYCINEFCPAKLVQRLDLFTSRNAMNIDGLSVATLNLLVKEDIVKSFSDLYKLSKHKEKIINLEGLGEKSYNNIINSVEKSRNVKLANFIYALGIKDVGLSRAKLICKYYSNDIEKIKHSKVEELSNIPGLGEIIASNFVLELNNEEFLNEFNKLVLELNFIDEVNDNNILNDNIFVITGSVNQFKNRDQLIEYIESNGGKVVSAISKNVNYLINNDYTSTSGKNKKAKELNVQIITEDDLIKLVEESN